MEEQPNYTEVEVAAIIGFDNNGKIQQWNSKLFLDKKDACMTLIETQMKEYETLMNSINVDDIEDDDELKCAHDAMDDFYFDSMLGLKMGSGDEPKYYKPRTFKIINFVLTKYTVERIVKGEGFRNISQLDTYKSMEEQKE